MILWVILLLSAGLVGLGLFMIYNSFTVMKINLNAYYSESYQDLQVPTILSMKSVLLFLGVYIILNLLTQFNTTILDEPFYNSLDAIYRAGNWLWVGALVVLMVNIFTGEINIKLMGEKKFKRIQSLFIGFIFGFVAMWLLPVAMVGLAASFKIFA